MRPYFAALLSGVGAMHTTGVVYDLKLENVMLCAEDLAAVKIVDFGLAVDYGGAALPREGGLEVAHRSPEILAGAGYEGPPADVWALGIVIFSLAAGCFPLDEARSTDWRFARLAQERRRRSARATPSSCTSACPSAGLQGDARRHAPIDEKKRATVANLENRWLETPKIGAQGEYDATASSATPSAAATTTNRPLQLDEMMPTIGRQRAGCLE